jgi:hypothetical protein
VSTVKVALSVIDPVKAGGVEGVRVEAAFRKVETGSVETGGNGVGGNGVGPNLVKLFPGGNGAEGNGVSPDGARAGD